MLVEDANKLAIITRCGIDWEKFKMLLPVLTSKHMSLSTLGKVFNARIHSALLHRSETWAPAATDLQQLCRNNRSMVAGYGGFRGHSSVNVDTLCALLGVQEVRTAVHTKRLR